MIDRRAFLKSIPAAVLAAVPSPAAAGQTREPGNTVSADQRRLAHIAWCRARIRRTRRTHLITGYLAGQACYNLGEYPWREPWNPDEWDDRQLQQLRAAGVELIHVHQEWCDTLRRYEGDSFRPANARGFRRFVDMVHRRGLKLMVYTSSGFFEQRDPDFRPEWMRPNGTLIEAYWQVAACSPASPGWRQYVMPRIVRLMDEFGVDGIYNDLGYFPLYSPNAAPSRDEIAAFEESRSADGALEDLLGLIYSEIKRRGGLVKVHYGGVGQPRMASKPWDYLWVGEGAMAADEMREATKDHLPYVVPVFDMSRGVIDREDDLYLHAIPYLQFPALLTGRPFTGERGSIPGVTYQPEATDFWTRHLRTIWRHYQEHPRGPFTYGWWDSVPGRPDARSTFEKWLGVYRRLTVDGTWAYLDVDGDLFMAPPPFGVVVSVFANISLFIVVANYTAASVNVTTVIPMRDMARQGMAPAQDWALPARSLLILEA